MKYQSNTPGGNSAAMWEIPSTKDAEIQVIADLVRAPECITEARQLVCDELFSDNNIRSAWSTLCEMSDQRETIDLATVLSRVNKTIISEITNPRLNLSPTPLSVADHCSALLKAATRRRIYIAAFEMMNAAQTHETDYDELVASPGKLAEKIASLHNAVSTPRSIAEIINNLADEIQANQAIANSGKRTRTPTGFSILDNVTFGGFNQGNLIVLAARPSVGKTAIMLQMAISAARAKFPAMIFSLEMTAEELAQRMLFSTGKLAPYDVAEKNFNWEVFEKANGEISPLPIQINDSARALDDICNKISLAHSRGECGIVFIDYLGLIQSGVMKVPLYQAIAERTARLKRLAKECRIPVVLLCQLNRNSESEKREPQLHDLRDSGSIEQDADIVLMLERENHDLNNHNISMYVRKNRHGEAGLQIKLRGNDSFCGFEEC